MPYSKYIARRFSEISIRSFPNNAQQFFKISITVMENIDDCIRQILVSGWKTFDDTYTDMIDTKIVNMYASRLQQL